MRIVNQPDFMGDACSLENVPLKDNGTGVAIGGLIKLTGNDQ
jgi:hypothetical protein